MCGRYCLYDDGNEELRAILDKTEGEFKTGEIFPTDKAPILIRQNEGIKPQAVAWGFPGFRGKGIIINARAETVSEKPMFGRSLTAMRCLIPSSGFFEWSHSGSRIKYQFNLPNSPTLFMAGLYQNFGGERRFVIITTSANDSMIEVHNRMPVVLQGAELDVWLSYTEKATGILQAKKPKLVRRTAK